MSAALIPVYGRGRLAGWATVDDADYAGNRGAKSRYRGVSPCKQTGRWSAQVTLNGRVHWLGRFDTEEEAAQAAADFRSEHMPYAVESEVACP